MSDSTETDVSPPTTAPPEGESTTYQPADPAAEDWDEAEGEAGSSRVQYRGADSNAELRMVEIVKAGMSHSHKVLDKNGKPTGKVDRIWMFGSRTAILKAIFEPLNNSPAWSGQLKYSTLETKWRAVVKKVDSIIEGGEERHIRLSQNGGKDMSELDQLYLDLARKTKAWRDEKDREKKEQEEASHDAKERADAAMSTMAKRCGYDSVEQAEKALREEAYPAAQAPSPSPCPETEGQQLRKDGSVEKKRGSEGGSYGRGDSHGQQKRAKGDPALHLNGKADRAVSEDPVLGPKNTTDKFIDMIQAVSESDARVFAKLVGAQEETARAATESAKAQVLHAKAALVKEATSAVNAFVAAQTAGVELPPGLLKLINGDV